MREWCTSEWVDAQEMRGDECSGCGVMEGEGE